MKQQQRKGIRTRVLSIESPAPPRPSNWENIWNERCSVSVECTKFVLTLIVLHKYTHVKPAALPYLRVTAAAVLNKSVELDWN